MYLHSTSMFFFIFFGKSSSKPWYPNSFSWWIPHLWAPAPASHGVVFLVEASWGSWECSLRAPLGKWVKNRQCHIYIYKNRYIPYYIYGMIWIYIYMDYIWIVNYGLWYSPTYWATTDPKWDAHPSTAIEDVPGFQGLFRWISWWMTIWLVVDLPLWKIWKSVGMIIPNIWKWKNIFPTTNQQCMCFFFPTTFHTPKYPKCGDSIKSMFNLTQNATFYNKQINWKKQKTTTKQKTHKSRQSALYLYLFCFFFLRGLRDPKSASFSLEKNKKTTKQKQITTECRFGIPESSEKKTKRNTHKTLWHICFFVCLFVYFDILLFVCFLGCYFFVINMHGVIYYIIRYVS